MIADVETQFDSDDEIQLVMKLKMYEVENGIVKLSAEENCQLFDEWNKRYFKIPIYVATCQGGTKLYKYLQSDEMIIAVENKDFPFFADGLAFMFMAVKYNGNQFLKIGSNWYEGSYCDEEGIQRYNYFFASIGLNVDAKQVVEGSKCVLDFIENPVVMGISCNKIFVDYTMADLMSENPNVYYKIGKISFSRN